MMGWLSRNIAISKDNFVYVLSQWEMTLYCNVISHWLGTYIKWSLDFSLLSWWVADNVAFNVDVLLTMACCYQYYLHCTVRMPSMCLFRLCSHWSCWWSGHHHILYHSTRYHCFCIAIATRGLFQYKDYCRISNIRCTESPNLNNSRLYLAVVSTQSIEARCYVENEDVFGAAPTGAAPTTSEWSTILLPTKVCLILEVLQ